MIYDLIIIGGGPAGSAASVYASRKKLKTLLLADSFGGQSSVSFDIQNWIGTKNISGVDLAKNLEEHVREYASDVLQIKNERVESLKKNENIFTIKTSNNEYETMTVLISSGSKRKKLSVPGAEEFENKGITYCATCDGPIFTGKDVVVVGGGNAGFETASQLVAYTKSVTILYDEDRPRAEKIIVDKILANEKVKNISCSKIKEIRGGKFVESLVCYHTKTGEEKEIKTQGIFVEIGSEPNTDFAKDIIELDEHKQIVVNPKNQRTSVEGIWSAGDCTDGLYHQNNIAAGDAVKALEDIFIYLQSK
ncbi:FAD-dependent oxidoreductase [Patescibacteria group bacterium]|nr:FAD-dependent oxidoreductase [Patescibacteria group bacterium]MBU4057732.1 FAD-dependent oxidoreductase [Patescibacteria group bacterium]MBU4116091.1 FAD-dependent oxidoreductase [Patescibacteria group bacterium]